MQSMRGQAKCGFWAVLALVAVVGGCAPVEPPPPLSDAIVTVVEDVYRSEGQGRIIFLGGYVDNNIIAKVEEALQVKVRPEADADHSDPSLPAITPVLPETGELGIWISIVRPKEDEEGFVHIFASYARSGLDGAIYEYVLEATEDGWVIIDRVLDAIA